MKDITNDLVALKVLMKKGIIQKCRDKKTKRENRHMREVYIKEKGCKTSNRSYKWSYKLTYFDYDKKHIYFEKNPVTLKELLINKIFPNPMDDTLKLILSCRGLDVEPISYGFTEALFYMGESFASEEHTEIGYVIIDKS